MNTAAHKEMRRRIGLLDRGAISLSYTALIPRNSKASLVLVHGINDHRGRYLSLQEELARAGFANFSYDQRGFGNSGGRRCDIARYQDFHYDLKAILAFARKEDPNRPIFIIGHSLGGAVAATFCMDFPQEADGLVLSAPAYDVPKLPLQLECLATALNLISPKLSIRYPSPSGTRSHDPTVDRAVNEDPLISAKGTPRFYIQFKKMNHHFRKCAEKLLLPTLILQGGADRTVRPEGAKALFQRLKNKNKKLLWYDDFYHEVFHEIGREKVLADMLDWINQIHASLGGSD